MIQVTFKFKVSSSAYAIKVESFKFYYVFEVLSDFSPAIPAARVGPSRGARAGRTGTPGTPAAAQWGPGLRVTVEITQCQCRVLLVNYRPGTVSPGLSLSCGPVTGTVSGPSRVITAGCWSKSPSKARRPGPSSFEHHRDRA